MMALSIQEALFPDTACWGCGPANPTGLRLRSHAGEDGTATATFQPRPEHDNGGGVLFGGIVAALLDCHSGATVLHEAWRRSWGPPEGHTVAYVTTGLDIRYRRPAPLTETVTLRSRLLTVEESAITCQVWLEHRGRTCAEAVAEWKRPRARPRAA